MIPSACASLSSSFENGALKSHCSALAQGSAENGLSKETQHENCDIPLLATLVLLLSACSCNVEAAAAFCLFLSGGRKIT